ncbi:MAG: hypothetical protein DRP42_04230 [Tenericutes bacterium]|nr:MAG: hypothetical protein DRP42_04230 [Mycoplasmatota bacterium]
MKRSKWYILHWISFVLAVLLLVPTIIYKENGLLLPVIVLVILANVFFYKYKKKEVPSHSGGEDANG